MMTGITRKPAFWIAYALLSCASLFFALHFFPQAIPLLNLDVKMTSQQALTEAGLVADKLKLAPVDARRSVRFAHNGEVQNFVELEAGGKPAFAELLSGNLFSPYWWEVRLFVPGEAGEARVRFRPDGTAYGFARRLPESDPGAALDGAAARSVAEKAAQADWAIDLKPYSLIEQSQVERPSKRIDHVLTYERQDARLGEGRYRLRLSVSGDILTEVSHYVYVPVAFGLRYAELRSANETIARIATLSAGALYGIGGCILGVLWLLRKRWLLWKPALIAGAVVAGLNGVALLLNVPSAWFNYDTAQSTGVFWGQLLGGALLLLIGGGLALGLVFMAAESLSRRAFPRHPQLWKVWSRDAAASPEIAGRTLGGYLFVPIELALVAAFYYVSNKSWGWWQPSESLTDPNILGSYMPALGPIAMSLQAGFMEESLFRAVPLSIAAIVGERFGHRRSFIIAALILQALVFGGAHANYPGFPAYSRLVELIGPSLIWGLIFLRFGLVPTAILHALFDLSLFSIPLFLVEGPGSSLNRALVIAAACVPLGIVAWRRLKVGAWKPLPDALRNGGWRVADAREEAPPARFSVEAGAWSLRVRKALPVLGLAGLAAIVLTGRFQSDVPTLRISRGDAEVAARAALQARGVALSPDWHEFAMTNLASESGDASHKFVWREAGRDVYRKLVGTYLAPPLWEVRFARFTGIDVVERSEEWRVTVNGSGEVRQVAHILPEKRPGARLAVDAARAIAVRELKLRYGLDTSQVREVSAQQSAQPDRVDWQFTWSDPSVNVGTGGEARLAVSIAGDEVVGYGRYVFFPESWRREERNRAGMLNVVKTGMGIIGVIVAIAAMVALVMAWTRGRFDRRAFKLVGLAVFASAMVAAINQWPAFAMRLQTTEPLTSQIALYAVSLTLGIALYALFSGLLSGVASHVADRHATNVGVRELWIRGVCAGLLLTGVDMLLSLVSPVTGSSPTWPSFKAENGWLSWIDPVASGIYGAIATIAGAIVVLYWLDRLTAGWTRRRALSFIVLAMIGAASAAVRVDDWAIIVGAAIIDGALSLFLFATVLRYDLRAVPALVSVNLVIGWIGGALVKGTPGGALLAALGIATTLAIAVAATRYLLQPGHDSAGPVAPDDSGSTFAGGGAGAAPFAADDPGPALAGGSAGAGSAHPAQSQTPS